MPLYRPSELRNLLQDLGTSPKKQLSQNFLLDGNIIRKIVLLAEIVPGDLVLEIGPGPGALTEALLNGGAKVIAVEKDKVFAEALTKLEGDLTVYAEDILSVDLAKILEGRKAKVIANLPYHLTTPIMTKLIPANNLFSSIIVMVQDEVARRFAAPPGSKIYGSISVFLNFYSKPEYAFKVSKNCFYPKPKIESAVIKFTLHSPPEFIDENKFFMMTRTAFGHRRKMIHNSLSELYDSEKILLALNQIGKPATTRPEELSLEDFIKLYKALA